MNNKENPLFDALKNLSYTAEDSSQISVLLRLGDSKKGNSSPGQNI